MCGLTAYSLHISDAVPKLCCTFAPEIREGYAKKTG